MKRTRQESKSKKKINSRQRKSNAELGRSTKKRDQDLLLIHIIINGENISDREDSYRKLWSRYQQQLKIFIWRYIKINEDIEDVLQETFVKAFQSIRLYDKKFAFSTWLYRIASNTAIDYLRKAKLHGVSLDENLGDSDNDGFYLEVPDKTFASIFDIITRKEKQKLIEEAIEKLPKAYRDIILMRHIDELSYEEISKKTKMPLGTVKVYIFRSREMLYKILKKEIAYY